MLSVKRPLNQELDQAAFNRAAYFSFFLNCHFLEMTVGLF